MKQENFFPLLTITERMETIRKHLPHAIAWKGEKLGILEMRRHYTNYFKRLSGIKQHQSCLVEATSYAAVCRVLEQLCITYIRGVLRIIA